MACGGRDLEGDEDLRRPHAFRRLAGEGDEADLIRVTVVTGSSPDKDFEEGVPVAEEVESDALQGPELPPWMFGEYPEGALPAGIGKDGDDERRRRGR